MALRAIGKPRRRPLLTPLFSSPASNSHLHSNPSPLDSARSAPLSTGHLAHQLLDLFSHPPALRDAQALRHLGHQLTPEAAEAVIRDLRSWRSAHEFFRWAAWQPGFRHTCYTYNALASTLSRARQRPLLKNLSEEIVNARCSMTPGALGFLIRCLSDQGLVEEANSVFDHAVHLHCTPNSYTYNCLLEALAKAGRVEAIELRLKEMAGAGLVADKYTLMSALQCYCNAGRETEVLNVFNKINEKGWVDGHVLTVLVVTFCKWGKVEQACRLVERMEGCGMRLGEKTFCVLVHGFVKQGRVDKAIGMFEKMKRAGYKGDLALFSVLIEGLCEGKQLERAWDLYSEMKKSGVCPDVRLIKKMVSSLCAEGDLVGANRLVEEEEKKLDLACLVSIYNAILDGLVKLGEVDRAYTLLRVMIESQNSETSCVELDEGVSKDTISKTDDLFCIKRAVSPNADSFNIVISGLCKTQKLDAALLLLNDMIGMGCKGKLLIYNNLISELSNVDRLEESYELLRIMKEFGFSPTQFTHNSIFYCLCKREDLSGALDLLQEMRQLGHIPWIKHCTLMVQQLCRHGKVAEASGFLDDMVQVGFPPDMIAYSAVINGLCRTGDVDKALKLFRDVSSFFVPDVVAHNILINGFCKAGRLTDAREILNEMSDKGLVPSVVTYNSVIDGWYKANKSEEALGYFSKMIDEPRPPTVVTYTILIDNLFRDGSSEDAISMLDEMREKGSSPNKITYMALIHGLCKCGRAGSALFYFVEMKEKGFLPDTFAYVLLINSLILEGHTIKAFELLKEMLQNNELPCTDSKIYRLVRRAVCRLFKDAKTSSCTKAFIEEGHVPLIQRVGDITEDVIK